jgi:hypothetical protein
VGGSRRNIGKKRVAIISDLDDENLVQNTAYFVREEESKTSRKW